MYASSGQYQKPPDEQTVGIGGKVKVSPGSRLPQSGSQSRNLSLRDYTLSPSGTGGLSCLPTDQRTAANELTHDISELNSYP